MIYLSFSVDIAKAKNLMFNVIFYVVFFNYHFKISRGGFAANFIVECFQKSSLRKLYRSKVEQLIKKEVGVTYFLIGFLGLKPGSKPYAACRRDGTQLH